MIANNTFKKSMSIKILIPAKIKLRGGGEKLMGLLEA